jgi:hypothetical protein
MDLYLGQLRAAARKYGTKVYVNELNCAEVYTGTTDGGRPGDGACYDSVAELLQTLRGDYADVVAEINLYELLDQPDQQGAEAHFGLMYDLRRPKPTLDLLTDAAR